MKRYYFLVSMALYFAFTTGIPADSSKGDVFSEYVLVDAFEKGRSLVIVEILSVRKQERIYGTKTISIRCYRVKVIRPIVPGDLTKDDLQDPVELFAGASYGDVLKPGCTYALFVTKDCPYHYSWAHRDDVIKVDISKKENMQALVEAASRIYAKTSIRKFREQVTVEAESLPLSERIISLCEQFKTNPAKRADIGKQLYETDLGSRRDGSKPWSSIISYLPPIISLSREQILSLLGRPNLRSGWTYSWLCGQIGKGHDAKEVGVLSATFDKNETTVRVVYQQQDKSKWTKFTAYSINSYVSVCGHADTVLYRFQRALKDSNWERALSLCSKSVRTKAKECESAEAFFKVFMPLEQITALSGFPIRGRSRRAGKIVSLSFFLQLEAPEAEWPIRWKCSVVKESGHWLVDFKTLPVSTLIKKELLRRKLQDEDGKTRIEKLKKGIEFNLIPVTEEFVIGQPMLFRIEMTNVIDTPILYTAAASSSVVVNDPMTITGPNGKIIKYVDTSYQIVVWPDVILPDETIVLVDNYDVVRQYYITKPGRYIFQFKGWPRDIKPSNTEEIEVKAGELSAADSIFSRVLSVMPKGWTATRRLAPARPVSGDMSGAFINVHMIGKRTGKIIDVDIFLAIAEDESSLEPQFVSELKLWGKCRWGHVYVRARDAESLWPDYREIIAKALSIEEIKTD